MSLTTKNGNDEIYTPNYLAEDIIKYFSQFFKKDDIFLEPAKGSGSFYQYLPFPNYYCEVKENKSFFNFNKKVSWIITNPPFSLIRKFLLQSYEIKVDNIVYLITVNHILGLKARLNDMYKNHYGIKKVLLLSNTPKEFPQSGFQWGVIWIKKDYQGNVEWKHNFFKTKEIK